MSINSNITFVADTTAVDAAVVRIKKAHKDIEKTTTEQINQIRYMWGYLNQLMTLSIGMIQKLAKGTKFAAEAQKVGAGIQVIQTQVAIAHFLMMGSAYIASGNIPAAVAVFAVAAAMESSLVITYALRAKAAAADASARIFQAQIEAYSL